MIIFWMAIIETNQKDEDEEKDEEDESLTIKAIVELFFSNAF